MDYKRIALGIVGLGCLAAWVVCFVAWGWEEVVRSTSIAITGRVGLILTALWLAMPTLKPLFKYGSSLLFGSLLIILFVLATRPKIVPIVIGLVVVGHSVNWLLKTLAGTKPKKTDNT